MPIPGSSDNARLYSLDAARAVAALAVVLQHWEHFLSVPAFAAAKDDSPLYWLFQPLYEKGARAVTFFFCLSGFVFFWLYAEKVHRKTAGPATFAILRLSRLYPLHLATLLVVLVLQLPIAQILGEPFIYHAHDAKHFALNLLLLQYWGFEDGYSFNGPSWSISVEIFLYLAFFVACRLLRPTIWQCLGLALVAAAIARFSILAVSAVPFFIGGAVYYSYRALGVRWTGTKNAILVCMVILAWIILPRIADPGVSVDVGPAPVATVLNYLAGHQFEFVLAPLTVLALALSERIWTRLPWARLHSLGNMSFGIYLLHFPLQLAVLLVALSVSAPADTFTRPWMLAVFLAMLLGVAALSYHAFEKPVMDSIRRAWKRTRASPSAAPSGTRLPKANP